MKPKWIQPENPPSGADTAGLALGNRMQRHSPLLLTTGPMSILEMAGFKGDLMVCLGLLSSDSRVSLRILAITEAENLAAVQCSRPPGLTSAITHVGPPGRWKKHGTTCSYGRSWRPPSALALRHCPQPPVRTRSPEVPRVPLPHCPPSVNSHLWRLPMRGRGSWLSR